MTDKESWIDCTECTKPFPKRKKGFIWIGGIEPGDGHFEVCEKCMGRGLILEPPPPKRKLTILIDAGETTCARASGEFCEYVGSKNMGTAHVCMLFPPEDGLGASAYLKSKDGWLQRLPQCLDAERDKYGGKKKERS